jgi:uncharacterized protein YegL
MTDTMPDKADTPTKFEQTHISIILDRSGSMQSCAIEAIGSVNAYLADARKDAVLKEADLELTIFDSNSIDTIRSGAPVSLADITDNDYQPRGGTPLFDAIGRGIDSLDARLAKSGSSKSILVVMTDGQENSSRKYGHRDISGLIKARQAKGWLVIFLGAGLENALQGSQLGVRAAATASFATDARSMRSTWRNVQHMNASYAAAANPMEFMESEQAKFSVEARMDMGDESAGVGIVTPPAKPGADAKSVPLAQVTQPDPVVGRKPDADSWSKTPDDAWTK